MGRELGGTEMQDAEVAYKNVVLIPLAAYDDGLYAAMLIIREFDGLQSATGVLGHFPNPVDARKFALAYGTAAIDEGQLPEPAWTNLARRGHGVRHTVETAE
jgi:hypothetical protein